MSYIGTPPRKQLSGKVLLETQKASASSSLVFPLTGGIGSGSEYDVYEFHFINIHAATANEDFGFQANAVGESGYNEVITSVSYHAYHDEADSTTNFTHAGGTEQSQGQALQQLAYDVGIQDDNGVSGKLTIYQPASNWLFTTKFYAELNEMYYNTDPYSIHRWVGGYINTQTNINSIQFKMSSGNIDAGTIKMYGIKFGTPLKTDSKNIVWSVATAVPASDWGLKFGTKSAGGWCQSGGTACHEWDGSSWSTGGSTTHDRGVAGSGGTQTAGVVFGGYHDSDESLTTEEYNGTSWSNGNDMVAGLAYTAGSGPTQTWQICSGGSSYNPTVSNVTTTQTYNGTNWANESVASDGRSAGGMTGAEDNTLFHHGSLESYPQSTPHAQYWNGSSWASKANAPTIGQYIGHFGSSTRAYRAGGTTQDNMGAPAYYYRTGYACESWTDDVWTSENVMPFTLTVYGSLTGTGGDGWTGGGSDKQATHSSTVYTYHFEASEF